MNIIDCCSSSEEKLNVIILSRIFSKTKVNKKYVILLFDSVRSFFIFFSFCFLLKQKFNSNKILIT